MILLNLKGVLLFMEFLKLWVKITFSCLVVGTVVGGGFGVLAYLFHNCPWIGAGLLFLVATFFMSLVLYGDN